MQRPPEGRPRLPNGVRLGSVVAAALDAGRPVVALETAVVTHGLPPPQNLEALDDMRREVEAARATPAVCLVHEGVLCVGADIDAIRAVAADPDRQKISVRDLGAAIALGASGGLTVSATLLAAQLGGIRVFATGGIGGVHTGGAGDVSGDLHQLARSPVITVCSGAKSVLDIPRTLEYLETLGVPVFGYRTGMFPAFYLSSSGLPVPTITSPEDIARVARTQWALGRSAGLVVGNSIPAAEAIDADLWARWIAQAEEAARTSGIRGGEVTPYLLAGVAQLSEGRTVKANLALLEANARLAGRIAAALGP